MDTVKLSDISKWQNLKQTNDGPKLVSIDFKKFAALSHGGYIKATESKTQVDPMYHDNWAGATLEGLARGPYHFMRLHDVPQSAKTQANHFWETIKNDPGDLPPMLDVETNDDKLSKNDAINFIWKFILNFQDLSGLDIGIYTSAGFWDANITSATGTTDIPAKRILWTANWRVFSPPAIPWDWQKRYGTNAGFTKIVSAWDNRPDICQFWQWTNKGDGLAHGCTSRSLDLNHFNGSLDRFNKMYDLDLKPIGNVPVPPPPNPDPEESFVKITGLQDDALNLRASVWGTIIGKAFEGAVFEVVDSRYDNQGRLWYRGYVEGEKWYNYPWFASWYTEPV